MSSADAAPRAADQSGAAEGRAVVYLHIGARKSGTTTLQSVLRASRRELRSQGVNLALNTQDDHQSFAQPLKRLGGPQPPRPGAVEESLRLLRERLGRPARRHLVTIEGIAEFRPEGIAALAGALADHEVHVVLTVRPWDRVLPSEWQQVVKEHGTQSYPDFLAAVSGDHAPLFRRRHETPQIVRDWMVHVPAERIHVIAVPVSGEGLEELFCRTVGVDPASLQAAPASLNQSLSYPQAELLRRVNAALPEELHGRDEYRLAVRGWLVRRCLALLPRAGALRLPTELATWCEAQMKRHRAELEELGIDLVGDPDDLTPPVRSGEVSVSEAEVSAAAVALVASMTALRWEEWQRSRHALEEATRAASGAGGPGASEGRRRRTPATIARGIGRRLRRVVR
ncbi:hypothetical protein [Nocardioides sambongensis]|uniref:hypothetical protein n=1 Tax=Nocardioides sambongensis TaxID=2589074 RepID=UPI0011267227|nr:hypothetical protein [Nocardioides sambongensis]